MNIREVDPDDHSAIRATVIAAFQGTAEADLIEQLRADGEAEIELVADENGEIAGHVLFSPMDAPVRAIALAPVAVRPDRQKQGVGSALIEAGHRLARVGRWEAIFLLGDPTYYRRFGYSVEAAAPFDCAYSGEHFMLLPLVDPLPASSGELRYAPAFASLG